MRLIEDDKVYVAAPASFQQRLAVFNRIEIEVRKILAQGFREGGLADLPRSCNEKDLLRKIAPDRCGEVSRYHYGKLMPYPEIAKANSV